jgi:hypothetical protein
VIYTLTSDIFPEQILTGAKSSPSLARPARTDYYSHFSSLWLLLYGCCSMAAAPNQISDIERTATIRAARYWEKIIPESDNLTLISCPHSYSSYAIKEFRLLS